MSGYCRDGVLYSAAVAATAAPPAGCGSSASSSVLGLGGLPRRFRPDELSELPALFGAAGGGGVVVARGCATGAAVMLGSGLPVAGPELIGPDGPALDEPESRALIGPEGPALVEGPALWEPERPVLLR